MPKCPTSPETLSPQWLTAVLRAGGGLIEGNVIAFTAQKIGTEVGFLDVVARVTPTYDRACEHAPASLVVKISSSEGTYRQIGNFYNAYEREGKFYETVAPGSVIRLARYFGRDSDPESGAHALMLEDLAALDAGDQVQGLTLQQALATVETIGRFHAQWWDSPRLATLDWMPHRNLKPARFQAAWPKFRELFGPQLPPAAIVLGDELAERLETLLEEMEQGPHTIVHSDFRADNLLFDARATADPVVVLDWQLAIRGRGIMDVARLLCGSLKPRDRAECEVDLLRGWHETLLRGGVREYSWARATEDYRKAVLLCLYYPVTIHEAEEAAGKRGAALAHEQIERFFAAAEQWFDSAGR
ncbi:MAG: hypothetical protein C0483_20170 [Pirellula sp.]|nr:hypothetical protein [Pirellula sp.]